MVLQLLRKKKRDTDPLRAIMVREKTLRMLTIFYKIKGVSWYPFGVRGTKYRIQGTEVQNTGYKVQGTKYGIQGTGYLFLYSVL